jgi:hypothetical protein
MSQREELQELIDQLDDNEMRDVLGMIRWLRDVSVPSDQTSIEFLARLLASGIVPGWLFFAEPSFKLMTLESIGVAPIKSLDDLQGDICPEDESVDDFIAAYRSWRRGEDV